MIEIFLVVAMLVVVVVGFLMGLRPFFTPKLMVLVTGVTAVLTSVPHIVWTQDSPDLTSAATYMSVSFFVSSMLWDSRSFLIDNFCFKFILYRPAYLIVPVMLILQLSAVVDLDVSVGLVVVQVLLGALVSETTYSVAKRNDLILRTYRRRGSLPRMQTMPTTPQLPV